MYIAELEARYDGPIPAALRAKATYATPRPAAAITIARVTGLKPIAAVPAMAAVIAELVRTTGCATEADLRRAGYTDADIRTHGQAATALARQTVEA